MSLHTPKGTQRKETQVTIHEEKQEKKIQAKVRTCVPFLSVSLMIPIDSNK